MTDLHPGLREAQLKLADAGILTVKHGERLIQYAPGIVGLYLPVTVERLPSGKLLVGGGTTTRVREVLIEAGLPVVGQEGSASCPQ
jgi:hypothetical protein